MAAKWEILLAMLRCLEMNLKPPTIRTIKKSSVGHRNFFLCKPHFIQMKFPFYFHETAYLQIFLEVSGRAKSEFTISCQVSHHPMIVACHCDGTGWKFWGDSNLKSKFWGRSIQLDPVGVLTLQFEDGEVFQWNKVKILII